MAVDVLDALNTRDLPASVALPQPAITRVIDAIKAWGARAPVTGISVTCDRDPEANDWEQVVLSISVNARDDSNGFALWDELAEAVDRVKAHLSQADCTALDRHLAIQLDW